MVGRRYINKWSAKCETIHISSRLANEFFKIYLSIVSGKSHLEFSKLSEKTQLSTHQSSLLIIKLFVAVQFHCLATPPIYFQTNEISGLCIDAIFEHAALSVFTMINIFNNI